jgi:hypothetical protein
VATFGKQFLQQMANPSYGGGLFTAAQQLGALPAPSYGGGLFTAAQQLGALPARREALAKQEALKEQLSNLDLSTPQGLAGVASIYQQQGDMENAAKFATQAKEMAREQAQQEAFEQRKNQVSTMLTGLGLDGLAEQVPNITDPDELGDIVSDATAYRLKNMPTQTPAQRRQLAGQRGINKELFDKYGLGTVPDQAFNDFITGQRGGKIEYFLQDDEVKPFRVEGGQVWNRAESKWMSAQGLGLRKPPPEVQRIEQLGSTMAEKIMGEGVKGLSEARDAAKKAYTSVESIDESLDNIDNMYTGYGATFRKDVARAASLVGVELGDLDKIKNTEKYASLAGARVADYITNLGAGTGLSDKDREFAEKVVAADISMSPETMKQLLTIIRSQNLRTINNYNTLRSNIEGELTGREKSAMAFYLPVDVPAERAVAAPVAETTPTEVPTGMTPEQASYFPQ